MADTANGKSNCHWVAIDVARYWNAVLIETATGERHRFRMSNDAVDLDRLIGFLKGQVADVTPRWSRPVIITVRLPIASCKRG